MARTPDHDAPAPAPRAAPERRTAPASPVGLAGAMTADRVLALQRTAGNDATTRYLRRAGLVLPPPPEPPRG